MRADGIFLANACMTRIIVEAQVNPIGVHC